MEIKASAKQIRISPRKVRLLTNGLRGLKPEAAITRLTLQSRFGAEYLIKLIKQAVANAVNNNKLDKADLKIERIEVGDAFSFKRMDRSHGARFSPGTIKKKSAHLFLTLTSGKEVEKLVDDKSDTKIKLALPKVKAVKPELKPTKKRGNK